LTYEGNRLCRGVKDRRSKAGGIGEKRGPWDLFFAGSCRGELEVKKLKRAYLRGGSVVPESQNKEKRNMKNYDKAKRERKKLGVNSDVLLQVTPHQGRKEEVLAEKP